MLSQPMIRDVSIASQKKRRLVVVATYAIAVAFAAVVMIEPSLFGQSGSLLHLLVLLVVVPLLGLVPGLFYFLVKLPIPGSSSIETTRLGLTPGPRDPDDPDERQVTIRNAAHYKASRFLILYCSIFCIVFLFLDDLNSATVHRLMESLVALLLFLVWSLPPAIILWTEPDVPQEVRE